jgi:hypothetical protein
MGFPSESLIPSGGEIYCHVFENKHTGLARNLFWSITITFEPIQYRENEVECSMTCEWITWPIRDWRDLDGRQIDLNYGEDGVESSFYTTRHDFGNHTTLSVRHRIENRFAVSMSMLVDFLGYYGGDENPAMMVHAEADVPFTGLIILPENLFPKPITIAEVESVAADFVDLSSFRAPELRHRGFILCPRLQGFVREVS